MGIENVKTFLFGNVLELHARTTINDTTVVKWVTPVGDDAMHTVASAAHQGIETKHITVVKDTIEREVRYNREQYDALCEYLQRIKAQPLSLAQLYLR